MSSIKTLKNFLAITRHKSVAAAAREIGLTAAAAGQQLQQLEIAGFALELIVLKLFELASFVATHLINFSG